MSSRPDNDCDLDVRRRGRQVSAVDAWPGFPTTTTPPQPSPRFERARGDFTCARGETSEVTRLPAW
jgi:hypothetical protein